MERGFAKMQNLFQFVPENNLLPHIHIFRSVAAITAVVFPLEQIRVKFTEAPAEIYPCHLRITTAENFLGEKG